MSKNTKIENFVPKLVKVSFINKKLNPAKVRSVVDTLKKLSKGNAVKGLQLYLNLLKKELDSHRLYIETPVQLSQSKIDEITKIAGQSREIMETEVIINPSLLGGFRIKIGDEVYEDSVSNKIDQIGEALIS